MRILIPFCFHHQYEILSGREHCFPVLMDSCTLRLSQLIPAIFYHCASKPEVVFSSCFRCFSCDFSMNSDSLRLSHFIPTIFHHGGSKPEVVFSTGVRCLPRGFSINSDSPRPRGFGISAFLKIGIGLFRVLIYYKYATIACFEIVFISFNILINQSINR